MKRLLTVTVAALAVTALAASALAQAPPAEVPFPAPKADVFVYADTVTGPGSSLGVGIRTNFFPRGASVVFRAFAGDVKTSKVLTDKDVKYFYAKIPGQPNVKLAYSNPGNGKSGWLWTGTWKIPADYPLGAVAFKVLVKTNAKRYGSFQATPVATTQLTVTAT